MKKIDLNRVLVTGAGGMAGSYVDFGIKADRKMLDVTNLSNVLEVCRKLKPSAIVHLAAETDLEVCEKDPQHAYMVNAVGTYHMALAAKELGIKLVYVSTAGVFDGTKKGEYTEKDKPNPQNIYGASKHLGELAVTLLDDYIIARVCWMFGGGKDKDKKFVAKIWNQLDKPEIKAVTDQIGSPTYAKDLIAHIKELLLKDAKGIYNLANAGVASRYDVAKEIVKISGKKVVVKKAKMSDFGLIANRTYNEGLRPSLKTIRPWQEALREYIEHQWKGYETKNNCRICGKELTHVLDLGSMPPANSFLENQDDDEESFPLRLSVCPECLAVQLHDTVDAERLFKRDYYYFTSASAPLAKHFEDFGKELSKKFELTKKDLVVEMGSNDGVLLGAIKPYARVLGVDPASNVHAEAKKRGVDTVQDFFNEMSAANILQNHGQATLILGNNVFAHIDDVHSVLRGVKKLLSPEGQFIAEVHWVGNLLGAGGFDQIYHEHIYYFSAHALKNLVEKNGLTLSHVELIPIHGQSLRVYITKDNKKSLSVEKFLKKEKELGLDAVATYASFAKRVRNLREELIGLLKKLKKQNKKIAGYGAPAKGNTLLNYFGIGPDMLDYITDTTPAKQGTYTPGTHIPIVSPEKLKKDRPEYILLLSWNYADDILMQEEKLRKEGVKFILPIPTVRIV